MILEWLWQWSRELVEATSMPRHHSEDRSIHGLRPAFENITVGRPPENSDVMHDMSWAKVAGVSV